ncbi:MAG: cytochrome c [Myxococcota bacterium]
MSPGKPVLRGALLALLALACEAPDEATAPDPPPSARPWRTEGSEARGRELLARYECNRCHEGVPGAVPPPREKHCVGCHAAIADGTLEGAPPAALPGWRARVRSLREAPSLAVSARFDRDALAAFLREPHDLRPELRATMPRLAIDERDAADLATALVPGPPPAPLALSPADAPRGRAILEARACGSCHRMGGAPALPGVVAEGPAVRLAPDLRHARARYRPRALVAWLRDPRRFDPHARMPPTGLGEEEARAVAAHLFHAELAPAPVVEVPARLPLLARPVTYTEVDRRLFAPLCRHCHGDPSFALGDGGPGHTGGFGFAARGIDLASVEGVASGHLRDGRRRSLFAPTEDGTPFIVASLMARYAEVAGAPVPGLRGMPLGLPPVPLEDVQLLETWIAAGRPE